MFSKEYRALLAIIINFIFSNIAVSQEKEINAIKEAIAKGDVYLNFRFRTERAKQSGLKTATANTLQSKLGYSSTKFWQNNINIEAVNVINLLGQHYNHRLDSNHPNPTSQYAIVSDPPQTGITNANIVSKVLPNTELIFGRQYITLDNERMVGNNDFRQYPTSFDAITVRNNFAQGMDIFISYASRLNTYKNNIINLTRNHNLNTFLINLAWKDFLYGKLSFYGYSNNDRTVTINSQNTVGIRLSDDDLFKQEYNFGYELEAAYQKSRNNNPNKYSAIYFAASFNKNLIDTLQDIEARGVVGYEFLGGHSGRKKPGRSFRFPLGSPYGFNGLAEGFTITPDRGLMDWYAKLEVDYLDWLTVAGELHCFQFVKGPGSRSAGRELDLETIFKVNHYLNILFRIADLKVKNNSTRSVRRLSGQINLNVF